MKKKNNKGFTLIEVLVAMAVLGVVVVPALQVFVTSARTNAKARDLLNANMVAENMMEELKVKSIEEIIGDEVQGDDGSRHHFSVRREQDGSIYEMQITLVPKTSQTAEIHSMDEETCGYYVQPSEMDRKAAEEFYRRHIAFTMEPVELEVLASKMDRTITIQIDESADKKTSASITYAYELSDTYVAQTDTKYSVKVDLYDEASVGGELEALHVYYYPIDTTGTDNIWIKNNGNGVNSTPVTIYLVELDGVDKKPTLNLVDLKLNNQVATKICTNLTPDDCMIGQGSSIMTLSDLAGSKEVLTSYDVEIAVYKEGNRIQIYNGSVRVTEDL